MKENRYDLVRLFCLCDNLIKFFNTKLVNKKAVGRPGNLSASDLLTLSIFRHLIGFPTIKSFHEFLSTYHANDFNLPSYAQFNENLTSATGHTALALSLLEQVSINEIHEFFIVDSTPLPICANAHRHQVKIDHKLAGTSKNLNGWYHGFKLHIIVTNNMDIAAVKVTSASVADSKAIDLRFLRNIDLPMVGDKGYVSKKLRDLFATIGISLITRARKNMKQPPATPLQIRLLKNRIKVETVFSLLKAQFGLVARYARSLVSFFANVLSAIVAYGLKKHFYKIADLIRLPGVAIS